MTKTTFNDYASDNETSGAATPVSTCASADGSGTTSTAASQHHGEGTRKEMQQVYHHLCQLGAESMMSYRNILAAIKDTTNSQSSIIEKIEDAIGDCKAWLDPEQGLPTWEAMKTFYQEFDRVDGTRRSGSEDPEGAHLLLEKIGLAYPSHEALDEAAFQIAGGYKGFERKSQAWKALFKTAGLVDTAEKAIICPDVARTAQVEKSYNNLRSQLSRAGTCDIMEIGSIPDLETKRSVIEALVDFSNQWGKVVLPRKTSQGFLTAADSDTTSSARPVTALSRVQQRNLQRNLFFSNQGTGPLQGATPGATVICPGAPGSSVQLAYMGPRVSSERVDGLCKLFDIDSGDRNLVRDIVRFSQ